MKRRKSGQGPDSVDDCRRELERLNVEIAEARSREVGRVMDRILKMMAQYSISLAELERYRRASSRGASKTLRFRAPLTGERWSIVQRSARSTTIAAQTDDGQTDRMSSPDPDSKA